MVGGAGTVEPIAMTASQRVSSVGALVALTLVTVTISESIFWGQPDMAYGDPLGLIGTFIAYGILVIAVIGVLERIAPSTWLGVFLGGALLGWGIEGIVVTTTYESLPLSISFTGLAWHALLSVAWGWVLLPRWLTWRRRGLIQMATVGVLWGLWGTWQGKDSGEFAPAGAFAWYAVVAGIALSAGVIGWLRWRSPHLVSRIVFLVALGLIGLVAAVRVITLPWAPLILGPLIAGALWSLRRLPRGAPLLITEPAPAVQQILAGVAIMVTAAIGTYALARGSTVPDGYGPAVYVVTTATGFILFGRALWQARRASDRGESAQNSLL